jgi:hypothetical protein
VAVEVRVKGLLGGLKHQMAIGATVNVPGNNSGDTRRETTFEVFTNQADGLSTSHGAPEILFPAPIVSTNRSNWKTGAELHDYPIKSTIYEKVKGS